METQEEKLQSLVAQIGKPFEEVMAQTRHRQDYLVKPPGSLGRLEDISAKVAGITGKVKTPISKFAIAVMCADNGVVEEGVASAPQSVTLAQTINFTRRLTGVGTMAKHFNIPLLVIDVGVAMPIPDALYTENMIGEDGRIPTKIVNRRLADGTCNLARKPAMPREDAVKAILIGIEAAKAIKDSGADAFGIGEMGIGNTTSSSSVLCALTRIPAEDAVGRGGGLKDEGLKKKVAIVREASKRCIEEGYDVLDILANVGGYDICAMTGAFLGAGIYRLPVVVDGVISIVAALAAKAVSPNITDFMFASHKSKEPGYEAAMNALGLYPLFDLRMRLGEGSGCPIAFNILETASSIICEMATFEEGEINDDYMTEIREKNLFN
ncbi:MAG: nicotinate-nucleotide--dimethylbenzimidazole phosphoribosyltransferase [Clostridiales bacterium]|nr:nicotinate-nucleotide--dimethylbenzimidazole phosphoribosyltransferase [Clostridiales bacterium]MDY4060956.1 nicotinate-nucleotide--dimethylbenzimidazole phosphoribosyltransferase [Anaerovoracaceae bacterium]